MKKNHFVYLLIGGLALTTLGVSLIIKNSSYAPWAAVTNTNNQQTTNATGHWSGSFLITTPGKCNNQFDLWEADVKDTKGTINGTYKLTVQGFNGKQEKWTGDVKGSSIPPDNTSWYFNSSSGTATLNGHITNDTIKGTFSNAICEYINTDAKDSSDYYKTMTVGGTFDGIRPPTLAPTKTTTKTTTSTDSTTTITTPTPSGYAAMAPAKLILAKSDRIDLSELQSTGADTSALQNIKDIAEGKCAKSGKNTCLYISPKLLETMAAISKYFHFSVSAIVGGTHKICAKDQKDCNDSNHYAGQAFDINNIYDNNGKKVHVAPNDTNSYNLMKKCLELGFNEVIGPNPLPKGAINDTHHNDHVHCGFR